MAYRGAIFDLDGTLIDSTWVWEWVDHEFPKRLGVVLPEHYSEQIALLSPEEAAAYTIQTLGLDMPVDEMRAFWSGMGLELYQTKVKLKPGVKELLRDLKNKGVRLAVATASEVPLCEAVLKRHGIYDWFDAFGYTLEFGKNKQHPDIFCACAERLALPESSCVVFDDLVAPLHTAHGLSMGFVAVEDQTSAAQKAYLQQHADAYVCCFTDFMQSEFYQNNF